MGLLLVFNVNSGVATGVKGQIGPIRGGIKYVEKRLKKVLTKKVEKDIGPINVTIMFSSSGQISGLYL